MSGQVNSRRGPARFKFLHAWVKHQGFMDVVRQSWGPPVDNCSGMASFHLKLFQLKMNLKVWNKEVFGNIFHKVKEAEDEVTRLEHQFDISASMEDRIKLSESRAKFQRAIIAEESFLKQQSSIRWIHEGDANTRFFHGMIRKKRQSCHIHRIKNTSGSWITEPLEIANSAVQFFQNLLLEQHSNWQASDFDFIPSMITTEDEANLSREPTIEEVKRAVFSMDPDSTPGPDGFCAKFYQVC